MNLRSRDSKDRHFDPLNLGSCSEVNAPSGSQVQDLEGYRTISAELEFTRGLADAKKLQWERAANKLARYANSLQQPTFEHLALATAPWKQHADPRIRQAQTYIERQFRQDLSVSDVASRVAMSERNFTRRFRAAAGLSPARYLTKCRIEHARQLLEFEHLPVLTVAMRCGFRDESAFRRSFRHLCGVTPSAYRAAAGAGDRNK